MIRLVSGTEDLNLLHEIHNILLETEGIKVDMAPPYLPPRPGTKLIVVISNTYPTRPLSVAYSRSKYVPVKPPRSEYDPYIDHFAHEVDDLWDNIKRIYIGNVAGLVAYLKGHDVKIEYRRLLIKSMGEHASMKGLSDYLSSIEFSSYYNILPDNRLKEDDENSISLKSLDNRVYCPVAIKNDPASIAFIINLILSNYPGNDGDNGNVPESPVPPPILKREDIPTEEGELADVVFPTLGGKRS